MALPINRGCCRLSAFYGINRLFAAERLYQHRSHRPRCPPSAARVSVTLFRPYSSDKPPQKHKTEVMWSDPNSFFSFWTKICILLIRTNSDKDFTIEKFTEVATQAFLHVSRLLSLRQFNALEGLVATDLIGKLDEKCSLLSTQSMRALSADEDDILQSRAEKMGLYIDDNDRMFVKILMRFRYMSSAKLDEEALGAEVFSFSDGTDSKKILTANYEFQREFTEGVEPEWIITRIEHSKVLD